MILLIDNNDSFTYNIVEMLRQTTDKVIHVARSEDVDVSNVEIYDRIIFSPGPGLPDDFPVMSAILDRYRSAIPILGICLGHQAICEYFGAHIVRLDQPLHGVDSTIDCDAGSRLFRGVASMKVGRYHSWTVSEVPESLKVTATDRAGNVMAVEHRAFPVYGVQFHPESHISQDGRNIFKTFING